MARAGEMSGDVGRDVEASNNKDNKDTPIVARPLKKTAAELYVTRAFRDLDGAPSKQDYDDLLGLVTEKLDDEKFKDEPSLVICDKYNAIIEEIAAQISVLEAKSPRDCYKYEDIAREVAAKSSALRDALAEVSKIPSPAPETTNEPTPEEIAENLHVVDDAGYGVDYDDEPFIPPSQQ